MSTIAFDAFEYAHQLREVGITEQQAEVFAKKTAEILKIAVESAKEEIHSSELATKRDLKEVESALKHDLKDLELVFKRDIKGWVVNREVEELNPSLDVHHANHFLISKILQLAL